MSSTLTNTDRKHWEPQKPVIDWLVSRLSPTDRVLEIGPGYVPFPRADEFVDAKTNLPGVPKERLHNIDLNREKLPFPDKSFDFIYCRHVIEDMYSPFLLLEEMGRVGKRGYIEMPSPTAELGRGVDGNSPPFRGYHHHHYIGWVAENELRLVSKYPLIEYLVFEEQELADTLRAGPENWNTHYLWEGEVKFAHRRNGYEYLLTRDYAMMLQDAARVARTSNLEFWGNINVKAAA